MDKVPNRNLLIWAACAGGFLLPWLFLPIAIIGAAAIFREFKSEYEEVWLHWIEKLKRAKTEKNRHLCTDTQHPMLKPMAEMV